MAEKYAIEDMQACMIIQVGTRWFECWLTKPPWYAEKAHNKNVIMNIRRPNRREFSVIGKNQSITELSIQSMIRNHSKRLSHPYFLINNTVVSQMAKWRLVTKNHGPRSVGGPVLSMVPVKLNGLSQFLIKFSLLMKLWIGNTRLRHKINRYLNTERDRKRVCGWDKVNERNYYI